MPSLKQESATLTDQYLKLLMAEIRLQEEGVCVSLSEVNTANLIRANISMVDESLRYHMRQAMDYGCDLDDE